MMQQQSFGYIISAFLLSYSFYLAINLAKQPKILYIFFYQVLSQTLTIHTIAGEGRGPYFYSSLSLQSVHEHSDIYLQFCLWDDNHVVLIAPLVITRFTTLLNYQYTVLEIQFRFAKCMVVTRIPKKFDQPSILKHPSDTRRLLCVDRTNPLQTVFKRV